MTSSSSQHFPIFDARRPIAQLTSSQFGKQQSNDKLFANEASSSSQGCSFKDNCHEPNTATHRIPLCQQNACLAQTDTPTIAGHSATTGLSAITAILQTVQFSKVLLPNDNCYKWNKKSQVKIHLHASNVFPSKWYLLIIAAIKTKVTRQRLLVRQRKKFFKEHCHSPKVAIQRILASQR